MRRRRRRRRRSWSLRRTRATGSNPCAMLVARTAGIACRSSPCGASPLGSPWPRARGKRRRGRRGRGGGRGQRGGGGVRLLDHGVLAVGPSRSRCARQVCSQLCAARSLVTAPCVVRTTGRRFVAPAGFSTSGSLEGAWSIDLWLLWRTYGQRHRVCRETRHPHALFTLGNPDILRTPCIWQCCSVSTHEEYRKFRFLALFNLVVWT